MWLRQIINIIICFLLIICFSAQTNATAPSLEIAPAVFDLTYVPGTNVIKIIGITNKGSEPILVNSKINNLTQNESLIKIIDTDFILQPSETKKVKISINIPETLMPGGYYHQILFEPLLSSYYSRENTTRVIPIIGALAYISVVDIQNPPSKKLGISVEKFALTKEARLKNLEFFINKLFGIEPIIAGPDAPFKFSLWIQNNDIYHSRPVGKISILDKNENIVGKTKFSPKTILPNEIKNFVFNIESTQKFLFGKYTALLSLDDEDVLIVFWIIPWKIMLSTVLTILLVLIFMIKYKYRIKAVMKILFDPQTF